MIKLEPYERSFDIVKDGCHWGWVEVFPGSFGLRFYDDCEVTVSDLRELADLLDSLAEKQ